MPMADRDRALFLLKLLAFPVSFTSMKAQVLVDRHRGHLSFCAYLGTTHLFPLDPLAQALLLQQGLCPLMEAEQGAQGWNTVF